MQRGEASCPSSLSEEVKELVNGHDPSSAGWRGLEGGLRAGHRAELGRWNPGADSSELAAGVGKLCQAGACSRTRNGCIRLADLMSVAAQIARPTGGTREGRRAEGEADGDKRQAETCLADHHRNPEPSTWRRNKVRHPEGLLTTGLA